MVEVIGSGVFVFMLYILTLFTLVKLKIRRRLWSLK